MRVPIRKGGKYTHLKRDPHMTADKFDEFTKELEHLKKVAQPQTAKEVRRLAEMGDLSENAGYQIAKGKLRGINERIIELEDHLNKAVIIKPTDVQTVQVGHRVTVDVLGKQVTYLILGSSETDPLKNIISHSSPLGSALMGRRNGETVEVQIKDKVVEYRIVNIE